jgi:hypothetical protein
VESASGRAAKNRVVFFELIIKSNLLIYIIIMHHYLFTGNLMVDAGKFLIILAIFMLGFSVHVAALNQPFEYRDSSLIENTITDPLPSGGMLLLCIEYS